MPAAPPAPGDGLRRSARRLARPGGASGAAQHGRGAQRRGGAGRSRGSPSPQPGWAGQHPVRCPPSPLLVSPLCSAVYFPARRFSPRKALSATPLPPNQRSPQPAQFPISIGLLARCAPQRPLPGLCRGCHGEQGCCSVALGSCPPKLACPPRCQRPLLPGLPAEGRLAWGCVCTRFPRPRPPVTSRLPPPALRHRGRMLLGSGSGGR